MIVFPGDSAIGAHHVGGDDVGESRFHPWNGDECRILVAGSAQFGLSASEMHPEFAEYRAS